jgi:hypothetical protein
MYWIALAIYALMGKWAPPKIEGRTVTICVAVAVIAFGITRNLPGLEALAPTPLP